MYKVILIFVHIIVPVISGCAIVFFTHWLSKRNQK
ncbi:type I toxin-antitoxin system Fst family toxin [Staphylococcus hyicus]